MSTLSRRQRNFGLFSLIFFFLIACSCPNPLAGRGEAPNPNLAGADIGEIVTASGVGPNNEPLNLSSEFSSNTPIIFAVAKVNRVDQGTAIFARWSRNNQPFEDTPQLVADRTYTDTFVEFHIEPDAGTSLEKGDYTVQFYINGNPGPQATFTVR